MKNKLFFLHFFILSIAFCISAQEEQSLTALLPEDVSALPQESLIDTTPPIQPTLDETPEEVVQEDSSSQVVTEEAPIPMQNSDEPAIKFTPLSQVIKSKQMSEAAGVAVVTSEPEKPSPELEKITQTVESDEESHYVLDTAKDPIYLGKSLKPWERGKHDDLLEFNFENVELSNLISYIEAKFDLIFILDDALKPLPAGGKSVIGTKISFRTHEPLTKKQAWDIFVTFLDMAGLAPRPGSNEKTYVITSNDPQSRLSVNKGPLPTFIGVAPSLIPDNDTRIRYVYFVENTSLDVIKNIMDSMRSSTSPNLIIFPELRSIIITDKAANIKAMLAIVQELDSVNSPEMLAVIKLKHADATSVANLYKTLTADPNAQQGLASRLLGGKKSATTTYFPDGTRIIAEPRTNTLILLGTKEAIKRVEEFIAKHVDRTLDMSYTPLHIYTLKYTDATTVAGILKQALNFKSGSEAAQFGSVRDGDKYFKPSVVITPEKSGNRLIINSSYDDFVQIRNLLQKIDIEQPQIALKVYILSVDLTNIKGFGTQIRNKKPGINGLVGNNVNFQTSTLSSPVIEDDNQTGPASGAVRLLGNLVNIASNGVAGSTLVTLGSDAFGVWGLLQALEQYTRISVVANPFLVTAQKYPAVLSIGTTRRVLTSQTLTNQGPQPSYNDLKANLTVNITPQITADGLITMNITVDLDEFTDATDQTSGNRTTKHIQTAVITENKEMVALGGLVRDEIDETVTKVPVLGDIPLVGWLFKNKQKTVLRSSLLVLITPEIIEFNDSKRTEQFTQSKLKDAHEMLNSMHTPTEKRDPVNRWFFNENTNQSAAIIDSFMETKERYKDPSQLPPKKTRKKKKGLTDLVEKENAQ